MIKWLQKDQTAYFSIIFILILYITVPCSIAQNFKVQGNISTAASTVENAKVTFIDKNDASKTYSGLTDASGNYYIKVDLTSVEENPVLPLGFELDQNYPNPFSSSTAIPYNLNIQSDVRVTIYDILGRVVCEIKVGMQSVGLHAIEWDGRNNLGQKVSAGVYLYRLEAGGESKVRKMVLNAGKSRANLSHIPYSKRFSGETSSITKISGNSFLIKIENTLNTSPQIISEQSEAVIKSDTTINFIVEKLPASMATVYPDSLQQIIRGFGAANIMRWRPDMTDDNIEKAFGTGDGQIGFSLLRLRIPPSENEFSYNVSTAQKAVAKGVTVFASPWSPPAALKSNNNLVGGYLLESSYAAYAAHLKSFVDYMGNNGVPVYAVSVQNEPDIDVTYESCDWYDYEMVKFVKENASSVGAKIIAPESFNFNKTISNAILNDPEAAANIDIVGGHLYGGGLTSYPLATSLGKELWMTEYLDLDTTWMKNLSTGKQINDCMHAGMNTYVWWYIIRYYGPIHEDGYVTKRGYVMSHYARFIRPGNYKIKCSPNPQKNVFLSTYKDETTSKIVIVAINSGTSAAEQSILIEGGNASVFEQYTTTSIKNCQKATEINVTGNILTVNLEPSSITTFISK